MKCSLFFMQWRRNKQRQNYCYVKLKSRGNFSVNGTHWAKPNVPFYNILFSLWIVNLIFSFFSFHISLSTHGLNAINILWNLRKRSTEIQHGMISFISMLLSFSFLHLLLSFDPRYLPNCYYNDFVIHISTSKICLMVAALVKKDNLHM